MERTSASESNFGHPGNEGSGKDRVHRPYWRRAHRDWRVWVGLFFMLTAITIFVMSDNLALLPRSLPLVGATGK
jgi:hypothetical protein